MSNLDAIDRSASIFCLGLVALLMTVAPLFGVGEDRFHVTLNARTTQATIHRYSVPLPVGGEASISSGFEAASVAQPTHRPSTGRAASIDAKGARPAATAVVANIAAALPAFGGGRPAAAATFVCVDFVCVNRSTAVRTCSTIRRPRLPSCPSTSFASCVQHCVATRAYRGNAGGGVGGGGERVLRRRCGLRRHQHHCHHHSHLCRSRLVFGNPLAHAAAAPASAPASGPASGPGARGQPQPGRLSLGGSLCATIGRASRAPPRRPSTLLPLRPTASATSSWPL